jgi:hypothetical protein
MTVTAVGLINERASSRVVVYLLLLSIAAVFFFLVFAAACGGGMPRARSIHRGDIRDGLIWCADRILLNDRQK